MQYIKYINNKLQKPDSWQFGGGSSSTGLSSPPSEAPLQSPPENQGAPPAKKDYDDCRIQVLPHADFSLIEQMSK